jgi:hypothetical protein
VIAVDLAQQLLQTCPDTYVLVVSHENLTSNWCVRAAEWLVCRFDGCMADWLLRAQQQQQQRRAARHCPPICNPTTDPSRPQPPPPL